MNKSHHRFLLVLAIAVTMMVAGLYVYMYYAVGVSTKRAAVARDIVALEKANSGREQDVRALYERTRENRESLPKFLIPADRVVEFIEAIEALGPQTGSNVVLSSIEENAPGEIPDTVYGSAIANVEATGSWSAVMRALSLAENFPYGVSISNTRVSTSLSERSNRAWKATFRIEAVLSPLLASSTSQ